MDGKRKKGRPTSYTEELADKICEAIATTPLGLSKICAMHDDFPARDTVFEWRYKHKYFSDKYADAKRAQADLLAEELIEIADDGTNDTYIDEKGNRKTDYDVVARSRLRVDTRKWYVSKLLPKVYGDKQQADVGEDAKSLMQKVIDKL